MEQVPELKKTVNLNVVSVAAIIGGLVVAFYAGSISERAKMQDHYHTIQIESMKQMIVDYHKFALDEVSGVRADMDKEDDHLDERLKKLEK